MTPFFASSHPHMGQVMKVWLSCYLVLLSMIEKPGNKRAAPSWPDPYSLSWVCFRSSCANMNDVIWDPILTFVSICYCHHAIDISSPAACIGNYFHDAWLMSDMCLIIMTPGFISPFEKDCITSIFKIMVGQFSDPFLKIVLTWFIAIAKWHDVNDGNLQWC